MPVLALIIIGIAAGFVATQIMGAKTNAIATMAVGVLGALVGGLLLRVLLTMMGWMAGFVGAVLGAMALIWLWRVYGPKSR